jgi:hypothetical protein
MTLTSSSPTNPDRHWTKSATPTSASLINKMKRNVDQMLGEADEQDEGQIIKVGAHTDVLFKVGRGATACKIMVSKQVICSASPVFQTMLSSPFLESHSGVVNGEDGDPDVYLAFFNMLHHQPPKLHQLSGLELVRLSQVAEMRGCTDIIRPFMIEKLGSAILEIVTISERLKVGTWSLDAVEPEFEGTASAAQLLDIAAFLKMDRLFWHITKLIATTDVLLPLQDPLPQSLYFCETSPGRNIYGMCHQVSLKLGICVDSV